MEDYKDTRDNKDENDKIEAIRHRQESRSEHKEAQSGDYEHEEKDLSYVDRTDRLTLGKIIKYIAIGMVILLFAVLIFRMSAQKKLYNDYFVWSEKTLTAYEKDKNLTVWVQNMSSYHIKTAIHLETDSADVLEFTYYPYSDPKPSEKGEDFEGCFMVGFPMYIEETKEFIITFRVNRTAGEELKQHYSLDVAPSGDIFRFSLTDGKTLYTDYSYITFRKNSYYYYRLSFSGVDYNYLTGYKDIDKTKIKELDLSVYYTDFFNEKSPIVTMTVANSFCPIEVFDLGDALPAKKTNDLKSSPEWEKED